MHRASLRHSQPANTTENPPILGQRERADYLSDDRSIPVTEMVLEASLVGLAVITQNRWARLCFRVATRSMQRSIRRASGRLSAPTGIAELSLPRHSVIVRADKLQHPGIACRAQAQAVGSEVISRRKSQPSSTMSLTVRESGTAASALNASNACTVCTFRFTSTTRYKAMFMFPASHYSSRCITLVSRPPLSRCPPIVAHHFRFNHRSSTWASARAPTITEDKCRTRERRSLTGPMCK